MFETMMKMSDGNPGAVSVLMKMFSTNEKLDPNSAFGPYSGILYLDALGIYGPDIWVFYKDICGEDVVKVIAVLRCVQLGLIQKDDLKSDILNGTRKVNTDEALLLVKERLPAFGG